MPCLSAGRSRTSWMDSAATMTSTSEAQPSSLGLQQHAPQARVDGQARQVAVRSPVSRSGTRPGPRPCSHDRCRDRADLHEQGHAVAHRAPIRGVQEREVLDRAQAQGRHLQDDARQRRTQDFRLREARARDVVGLRVQADRDAVRDAAASARALVRAGPADRLDRQALHLSPVGIAGNTSQTRVDDVADARHRQRRLGHVRGQDDAAQAVRLRRRDAARRRSDASTGAGPRWRPDARPCHLPRAGLVPK